MITDNCIVPIVVCLSFLPVTTRPVTGSTYHVSLSGDDKNEGTSPEKARRTIAHAATQAKAGDTVHIKAGDYGPENVVVENSGTAEKPIILQGYREKPGDIPAPPKIDARRLIKPRQIDAAKLPLINGTKGRRSGPSLSLQSREHVHIANISVASPHGNVRPYVIECAVHVKNSENVTLDNPIIANVASFSIYLEESRHCVVRNCCLIDGWGNMIRLLRSDYNLLENCATYGVARRRGVAPDYYIAISHSHDNIVRNCLSHNTHPDAPLHPGHGIGLRDGCYQDHRTRRKYLSPSSYRNKIIDCVARNNDEMFYAAHSAHNNEFVNCKAYGDDYRGMSIAFRIR